MYDLLKSLTVSGWAVLIISATLLVLLALGVIAYSVFAVIRKQSKS